LFLIVSRRGGLVNECSPITENGGEVKRPAGLYGECVAFVGAVSGDPDDTVRAADERYAVTLSGGDFGVDKDILKFLVATETQRTEAIARATGADGEVRAGLVRVEIGFTTRAARRRRWARNELR
jgi:hypothetical protein